MPLFALVPLGKPFRGTPPAGYPLLSADPGVTDVEYADWFKGYEGKPWSGGNPDMGIDYSDWGFMTEH